MATADGRAARVAAGGVVIVRPGRVLFGGLVLLYLLAYLRGTALLVAVAATVGVLLWRSRRIGGRTTSGASSRPSWGVQDRRVATGPLAAEVDPGRWPAPPTVVQGVPEPRAAGQPAGFAALVELRDHAGRQAMLQVEAAYPAEVELEQLVRQALTQVGRRAGWQLQRWRAGHRRQRPTRQLDAGRGVGPVSGRVWLCRPQVGRCVRGRDGDTDPMGPAAQSQLAASRERLLTEAATARYGGAGEGGAAGRTPRGRCWPASTSAGCRRRGCCGGPMPALAGGWG